MATCCGYRSWDENVSDISFWPSVTVCRVTGPRFSGGDRSSRTAKASGATSHVVGPDDAQRDWARPTGRSVISSTTERHVSRFFSHSCPAFTVWVRGLARSVSEGGRPGRRMDSHAGPLRLSGGGQGLRFDLRGRLVVFGLFIDAPGADVFAHQLPHAQESRHDRMVHVVVAEQAVRPTQARLAMVSR